MVSTVGVELKLLIVNKMLDLYVLVIVSCKL